MGIIVSIYLMHPGAYATDLSGISEITVVFECVLLAKECYDPVLVAQNLEGFQIFGVRPSDAAKCLPLLWATQV
jgi:hypothetical protein|tara:strand:+ start:2443 stop:2664 length:222 start_codon:yes stop_codon:yes gene_type:complete